MTKENLAQSIRSGFFSERDNLSDAFDYAYALLKNNPGGMTALHVVLNTVAKEILKIEQKETA